MITYEDFEKVEMRVGKIAKVEDFKRARNPSYKVEIDFGSEKGIKRSSVQAKKEYSIEELLGKQVIGVLNFPPKNIAGFMSEVLVLGVEDLEGNLSLLQPDREAKIGVRVY